MASTVPYVLGKMTVVTGGPLVLIGSWCERGFAAIWVQSRNGLPRHATPIHTGHAHSRSSCRVAGVFESEIRYCFDNRVT